MPTINDAITQRRFKQVNFLVNAGVNLNSQNSHGKTPLIQLCELEPEEKAVLLAKFFIAKGAKVDGVDKEGKSALMHAILKRRDKLVTLFLGEILDFNLNGIDSDGNTALAHAATVGNAKIVREIVQSLRKFGLTVDVRNKEGLTSLMIAAKYGHPCCAKVILNEGKADRFIRDNVSWKTASEWESRAQRKQPQFDQERKITSSLSSTSLSLSKSSQRSEIRRLFHVYQQQLSTTYRIGFDSSKAVNLYESIGVHNKIQNEAERFPDMEKTSTESQTRFLLTKTTAVARFKRNSFSLSARKLQGKKENLSVSFPPGPSPFKELRRENSKENQAKFETEKQKNARPRRPIRSRSEILYSKLNNIKEKEKEREKTFHCDGRLPRILLQEARVKASPVLTILEENENIDLEKQTIK